MGPYPYSHLRGVVSVLGGEASGTTNGSLLQVGQQSVSVIQGHTLVPVLYFHHTDYSVEGGGLCCVGGTLGGWLGAS